MKRALSREVERKYPDAYVNKKIMELTKQDKAGAPKYRFKKFKKNV